MKRTIDLPEELNKKVENYLQINPDQSLSNLVREALEIKLAEKDLSTLLQLAGIVDNQQENKFSSKLSDVLLLPEIDNEILDKHQNSL